LFEFRGRPLVLVTATEHYGAVLNRPFRFERYLADAAENRVTLTRLFMLFRELQSSVNPYSTCKPESPDYIAPFVRTGPGRALDGQPQFDLDQPNPEFFERLHAFLSLASEYGIVAEVVLFSNTYAPGIWALNPLNAANNVSDVEEIEWSEYNTERYPKLLARQEAHARKIVEETNRYDNVIYEICNEPGGGLAGENNPTVDEVDQWQKTIASIVRATEDGLPNTHLIAGQEALTYDPRGFTTTKSFRDFPVDVVNVHPLPSTQFEDGVYDMGEFMSKQLRLRAVRDYCLATYDEPKPLNLDEDNAASQYKDFDGWTIHRKRAWTTLLSGAHYDYIDFSIINYCEAGTTESQACIRSWMKHLSSYVHAIDLVRARPVTGFVTSQPEHVLASVLAVGDEEYHVYLADERELDEPGCGSAIAGRIVVDLPDRKCDLACYSPATAQFSPTVTIDGGDGVEVALPEFEHDVALRFRPRRGT